MDEFHEFHENIEHLMRMVVRAHGEEYGEGCIPAGPHFIGTIIAAVGTELTLNLDRIEKVLESIDGRLMEIKGLTP